MCAYIKEEEKKSALFPHGAGGGLWEKSVYRERKRCFSSLFCLVSLLFGNDLSILRDELTANLSLSRAFDRVSSLSFFSSRERLEKEKEVRRESVCFCPFGGGARKKNFTTHDEAAKTEKKRAEMGERSKRFQTTNVFVGRLIAKKKKKKIVII